MEVASAIARFEPVEIGPFAVSHLPVVGVLAALAFLASAALCARAARSRDVARGRILESHVVLVPVVILASRGGALVRAFPGFLHDGRALAAALVAPGCLACAVLAAVLALAGLAWASGSGLRFLDALAPGAVVAAGTASASRAGGVVAASLAASALVAALLLARWDGAPRGRLALLGAVLAGALLLAPAGLDLLATD